MTDTSILTQPMQYLEKALSGLRDIGLVPEKQGEAPMTALLDKITGLDENKVVVIARTLDQMSFFNEVVREQISAMKIGERYDDIAESFNSIRDDAAAWSTRWTTARSTPGSASRISGRRSPAAISPAASTRSRKPISTSPRTPRTRSNASTSSSRPIATFAAP